MIAIVLWVLAIFYLVKPIVNKYRFVTLHKIMKAGQITVITRNTPHCYYTYRDEPMGFEFELAKEFADYLGVELKVKIAENWEGMLPALKNGNAAIIAAGMAITPKRQKQVAFSDGYMDIQQHLISNRNSVKINKLDDLSGQVIHVRRASAYHERLQELQKQGFKFSMKLHSDLPTEELIQRVSDGEIELTVVDSNIALLNQRHYPGAIIAGAISDQQHLGWGMHPEANQLREKINSFFKIIKDNGKFDEIYDKYYGNVGPFDYVDLTVFHRRIKTRLSRYSPFIKAAAKKHGFDWRLIAAQIYQESHLDPWAKSPAGAKGLMQIMPKTAGSLDISEVYNPVDNINAGVRHLKNLYDHFDSVDGEDRLLISLAAYNVGQGHVQDARRLAATLKLDPNSWESISETLPLLSYRKYYKKFKYGYCRGTEPVIYVKQIMIYYDILKRQGFEYGEAQAKLNEGLQKLHASNNHLDGHLS
ncbi:MAG: membrane-bound lytic murein transglycosylase MltF [Deltaproteobacteria bacterium]|nr:membrane-bound lytic murein transglycosylase MltF [Deltaproteobacteria bacterium]